MKKVQREENALARGSRVVCLLTAGLVAVACGEGDDGSGDETGMSNGPAGSASSGAQSDAEGTATPPTTEDSDGADTPPTMTESADDAEVDVASEEPGDPSGMEDEPASEPGSVDSTTDQDALPDSVYEQACARAEECEGLDAEECTSELESGSAVLALLCPDLLGSYLECLGTLETCDPAVDCAEESAALEGCVSGSDIEDGTVQMACDVWTACDDSADPDTCVDDFEVVAPLAELACPGGFEPYIECIAQMTGCDPEEECAEEVSVLEECGLSINGMGMAP